MKIARNMFLVQVDDQFVRPAIKGFFIDTDYNPKKLATRIGVIKTCPIGISDDYLYDNKLSEGDEVVFSHLVCQKENKFSETVFFCDYMHIYAKIVKGRLLPLENVLFCTPIKEDDKNIGGMVISGKVSDKRCTVHSVSDEVWKEGVQEGDVIYFTKDADYPIDIFGTTLYKMYLRNIIGIERGGELKTFRNKLLVKNITKLGSVGGVDKIYAQSSLQKGLVIDGGKSGANTGDTVAYLNGIASIVEFKGESYSFIEDRNIKYVV